MCTVHIVKQNCALFSVCRSVVYNLLEPNDPANVHTTFLPSNILTQTVYSQ